MSSTGGGGYGGGGGGGYGGGGGGGYSGSTPRPLYGATVNDAVKRGNQDEIRQLLEQAKQTQQEQGDLDQAIKDLEAALNK